MSYILDALRRADAERERDPARGIHAQPATPDPADRGRLHATLAWSGAALAVACLAAYVLWPRPPQPTAGGLAARTPPALPGGVAVGPQPAPIAAVAGPRPAPLAVAAGGQSEPAVLPVAVAVAPGAPAALPAPAEPHPAATHAPARPWKAAPRVIAPAPGASAGGVPVAAPAVATAAHAMPIANAVPANAGAASSAPAAGAARIYAVSELPADVQRELPKLAISGGVHSENPAQRMLIVGGQVMFEGAELAPGVVLEQIRPKAAVLRFRGWRYRVGY